MTTITVQTWIAVIIGIALALSVVVTFAVIAYSIYLLAKERYYEWQNRRKGQFYRAEWQDADKEPSPSKFPIVAASGCPSSYRILSDPNEYLWQGIDWGQFCGQHRIVYWIALNDIPYNFND